MADEINGGMVSTGLTPVREGPTHLPTTEVGHFASAEERDDGTFTAVVRHKYEPLGRGSIPNAPAVYTTTLHVHHTTREKALKHAQIHVDCLNAVRDLLTNG